MALDPRTLQILMAMQPMAEQRAAMSGGLTLGPDGSSKVAPTWLRARDTEPMPPAPSPQGGLPSGQFAPQAGNMLAYAGGSPQPGPMPPQMDMPQRAPAPPPNRLALPPVAPPDVEATGSVTPSPAPANMLAGRRYDPAAGTNEPRFITPPASGGSGAPPLPPQGGSAPMGAPSAPAPTPASGGFFDGAGGDFLMGTLLGGGLRGGFKAAYLGGKERDLQARTANATNMTAQAALRLGVPKETVQAIAAMPDGGKQLADLVVDIQKTALNGGNSKFTDDQREYQMAVQQGYTGTFLDYQKEMKRAGASQNNVNVNNGENAFDKKNAENMANRFDALATEGQNARADVARIGILRDSVKNMPGGVLGGIQSLASQWGIKVGENASNVEVANSIINTLVPQQRPVGSGTMSDRDVQLFKDSLPSLSNTPEGNKVIIDTMQSMAEYKLALGEIAAKAQMGQISKEDAVRMMAQVADPLATFKSYQQTAPKGDAPQGAPAVGTVMDGYRFKGGDPSDQNNWERPN